MVFVSSQQLVLCGTEVVVSRDGCNRLRLVSVRGCATLVEDDEIVERQVPKC